MGCREKIIRAINCEKSNSRWSLLFMDGVLAV
jgi:hypothetical protein